MSKSLARFTERQEKPVNAGNTTKNFSDKTLVVGLGAMKSGTTWLSEYLKDHPDFFHSPIKEVNYFNTLFRNPNQKAGAAYRLERMETISLRMTPGKKPNPVAVHRLRDLAEIGRMRGNDANYFAYFAKRIGDENFFGEISPSYALLPPEGYAHIAGAHPRTKMLFFMRDPAKRAISNIQHRMRKNELLVDEAIDEIEPGRLVYDQSNYLTTLRAVEKGAPDTPFLPIIFEDMFNDASVRSICSFIGIDYRKANFENRVNAARSSAFTEEQSQRVREKLDPVYRELEEYFGNERPKKWAWT